MELIYQGIKKKNSDKLFYSKKLSKFTDIKNLHMSDLYVNDKLPEGTLKQKNIEGDIVKITLTIEL